MKSEDDQSNNGSNFGNKANNKLTRKRVMRRKNAVRRIQIHEEFAAVNNLNYHHQLDDNFHRVNDTSNADMVDDDLDNASRSTSHKYSLLQIIFTSNPSYYRIYSTVRQTLLRQNFFNQFANSSTNNVASPNVSLNRQQQQSSSTINNNLVNQITNNPLTNSFVDHLILEDEFKQFGQLCSSKNIPKVISMGLNVVLDIIKDTYEQNPKICIRALESLYNLLQGLKPECLKNEPPYMIERYFELIQSIITLSYSSIGRTYTNSFPLYENYHSQILELSLLSLITFSIARGDTGKMLNCIKILLIECSVDHHSENLNDMKNSSFHQYQQSSSSSSFEIEIPEILILLNKHVCSFLLGKHVIPEWFHVGFPLQSLCETFKINYLYHQRNLNNVLFSYKTKSQCPTSLTFDGQHLILYRCNRIFLIGSGYNNTSKGQEIYSSSIDISNLRSNQIGLTGLVASSTEINLNKCCHGGWIGYVNGDLFVQPHSNWSSNQIIQLDPHSLKFRNIVPLITEQHSTGNSDNEKPFSKPTLCTTDGDCLILISLIQDDYFIIRELKLLKINFELNNLSSHGGGNKEKVTFSLSSEFTIRLSSACFSFCGQSVHNLNIPYQNHYKVEKTKKPLCENELKLIETNSYCDLKNIFNILSGKDFALLLTDQGKIYYTGNSHSLGIRHLYSYDKWSLLNIPKPVKISQAAIGHEGNHALLLADDGTVFFVGAAKRGEDGESSSRASCRFNKPSRVKKFSKIDPSHLNPSYIACNHGTSAIVTKSGELYLFGKDSQHSNSKGLVTGLPKDFQVKSIALGKAHMLILSTKGLVISSGFSNKGQCGFNHNFQPTTSMAISHHHHHHNGPQTMKQINDFKSGKALKTSLDSRLQVSGHTFTYGKSRRCVRCFNCTENGTKCPKMLNLEETSNEFCICGYGNSGCINCGICSICSQTYSICPNNKNNDDLTIIGHSSKSLWNPRFGNLDLESDLDCPSKMTSIAPTILPLSQLNPIMQIATGLHHSILLSEKGEVFTFGSNQFGQLGVGDLQNRFAPVKVRIEHVAKGVITQIAAGSNHSVLLTSFGEVLTFGNNQQGQLGRSFYNLCNLNAFRWNTFPDRMNQIGPEYGRLASQISASGDFTFVKYDEILLSSNMFSQTKLMAEKNNLILIPSIQPQQQQSANSEMEDDSKPQQEMDRQKTCRHWFCCQQNEKITNTSTTTKNNCLNTQTLFNNQSSNILIISRTSGACSILKRQQQQQQPNKSSKSLDQYINFDSYSSMFIDKFYQNFWAYNSMADEFSRFNLISLEISTRVQQIVQEKTKTNSTTLFPTSMLSLYKFNNSNNNNSNNECSSHVFPCIKYVPSVIQPDISISLSDNCLLKKIPEQLALELFSALTSLTYSHLFGLSVNDKLDQMNYLAKNLSPEEYLSVCRYEDYGGGWGYPPHSIEAIRFSTDCDIILGGIGLYGGRGEYNVQIRLFDIGFDGSEIERDGDLLSETDVIHYECLPRQKYQIFFDEPLLIQANRWYIIWASINGPSSDCGSNGQAFVCTSDQVMFHFKPSKLSNNGTDVNSGQIPTLFYKQLKSNEFFSQYNMNNPLNISSLSMDDEGLPFSISKDFVLKINASCLYSLCEILRHVWNLLKTFLLHPNKLEEIFSCFDDEKLIEKLDMLIGKIRRNLYVACFSFELIRAYVQIFIPIEYNHNNNQNKKSVTNHQSNNFQYNQIQKFLHYDYDEYKRIANSLHEVCSLLTMILMNPIDLHSYLEERMSNNNNNNNHQKQHRKIIRQKLLLFNKFQNFFLDECYQTFLSCCNAFYPTYALKWSLLCDLFSSNSLSESSSQNSIHLDTPLFTNKQLYLLSAVARAYCSSSIKLISFFPIIRGSLDESFENMENLSYLINPHRDVSDFACQMISKRLAEFHPYEDYYLCKDYTCKFVYEKLLQILIKPLRSNIEKFHQQYKVLGCSNSNQPTTTIINEKYQHYRQFNNYADDNEHCEFSSSLSLSSSSSSLSNITTFDDEYRKSINDTINNDSQNLSSNNLSTFPNDTLSWDINISTTTTNDLDSTSLLFDHKNIYEQKLVSATCELLLKFISEFNACSLGLINMESNGDSRQNLFVLQNECSTPSRFCRRSSTKCWETGSGSPEAICFWITKPDIYISGVRVYASTVSQFKYQLQLLDQAFDDNKTEKNNFKWKTIASVSGVYSNEDNKTQNRLNDLCEIRFERPIHIHPNIKYALLFKNHSQYSYSGDMGLAQVRGDDDTVFTFMDCSLSKNGTNLNRGQIPHILYYNVPSAAATTTTTIMTESAQSKVSINDRCSMFDGNMAQKSIISMFVMATEIVKELLTSVIEVVTQMFKTNNNYQHSSESLSSSDSKQQQTLSLSSSSDMKILMLLFKTFDSIFFRQFLPFFMMYLKNLKFNPSLSHDLVVSIRDLIPLISSLNQMINNHFEHFHSLGGSGSIKDFPKEITHHVVVESDHPYKSASVTSYLVKFPKAFKFMTIEFDSKCCTAQPEDYLEIYIPQDNFKNLNLNMTNFDCHAKNDSSFKNLMPIYQRFSGKNFDINLHKVDHRIYCQRDDRIVKASSNCIFIPGNEVVLLLKTSSDYVHSADLSSISDAYYGFKVEIIGYEFVTTNSILGNDIDCMKNLNKNTIFYYVNHMIRMFECDLINLFGSCINSMMNSSPGEVLEEILNNFNDDKEHYFERKKLKSFLKQFDLVVDLEMAKQIFQENFNVLHKSFDLNQSLTLIKTINDLYFSRPSIHSFLEDFIKLNDQSSGARLALWLQNEAFILPNSCLLNIINDTIDCCARCCQFLLEINNVNDSQKLCSRCHYQFFTKALTQPKSSMNNNCINAQVGRKIFIKVVTRDQHEEIAYDPNACIEIQIRFISFFSNYPNGQMFFNTSKFSTNKPFDQDQNNRQKSSTSPILQIISQNPYQVTVKDKIRYHSITMMKPYENYSFEELRLEMHSLFNKKTFMESISVRSFDNGYYLGWWTPISTGCYRIELIVDGEKSENAYFLNVNNNYIAKKSSLFNKTTPLITYSENSINCTKIKLDEENLFVANQQQKSPSPKQGQSMMMMKSYQNRSVKHSIRKFICPYSAGLRIRALPSLQSEQIGIVAINGLLTIIDQLENDDGIWVRLSNESIQAYSSSNLANGEVCYQNSNQKDLFIIDNFESNLMEDLTPINNSISNNMKQSFTFTLRTEAWALQHNKHFNRTLLVAIDFENDINNTDYYHPVLNLSTNMNDQQEENRFIESLIVPGWFQVVICGNDGHLIRNWPSLDEVSTIIGIIPLNEIVYAIEVIQNEFGIWIRLSQDSLHSYISALYKSILFENNIEGWMLIQSLNGLVYLRNIQQNYFSSTLMIDNKDHQESSSYNNNSKYGDDLACIVPTKVAISNRAAQCIRAVFAAFVWHEGILNDVLTAASYLKFNAEITKDFVKFNETVHQHIQKQNIGGKKIPLENRRHHKVIFRHSVEVSQLMTMFHQSSDVNSNVNFLETNNNIQNNNNNENNNDDDNGSQQETGTDVASMIPEILINLLQIWDFVSTECLKIFSYFNSVTTKQAKTYSVVENFVTTPLLSTNNNESDQQCECETSTALKQIQPLFDQIIQDSVSNNQCDCTSNKQQQISDNKKVDDHQQKSFTDDPKISRKYVQIENMQQLYDALFSSIHFLLSLVPSSNEMRTDFEEHCSNPLNHALFFDEFSVTEDHFFSFQLLQNLGVKKSFYEQKLAEEKLSDLAILSLQQAEDHQHLLSPDFCDNWRIVMDSGDDSVDDGSINNQNTFKQNLLKQQKQPIENRKPSKFYRSISVGMNDDPHGHPSLSSKSFKNSAKHSLIYKMTHSPNLSLKKYIKSNETLSELDSTSNSKFNMPFLCKPSSKMISLIQKYLIREDNSNKNETTAMIERCQNLQQSPLMSSDLFKFIFSCYNIESYSFLVKSAICSSAYRVLALNILNWLLLNVSNPASVHDLMWIFVYSLLPSEIMKTSGNEEESSEQIYNKNNPNNVIRDVCRHPFSDLTIAGDMAEKWIAEALHLLMKSISNLLPLLPMGSPIQQMAVRCFGIEFNSYDHIFLHECKVFSHISTILTHSSMEDFSFSMENLPNTEDLKHSLVSISKDLTYIFELKTSSRQSMVASLYDNSTETFWESGNEDRNKIKHILLQRKSDNSINLEDYEIRFICVYIDNTRDLEYRVSHVAWKLCTDKNDPIKYSDLNVFSTFKECEKLKTIELDLKFCGWIQCELNAQQSRDLFNMERCLQIELNGPFQCLRIRQIKILAIENKINSIQNKNGRNLVFSTFNSHQVQTSSCETETLRVFRLLTSQVFGKLLSNDTSSTTTTTANNENKRWSTYQNNNENNLREHMVGILFSQLGKLTELQRQVCSHIVNEIHFESRRVREEWEIMLSSLSSNNNNNNCEDTSSSTHRKPLSKCLKEEMIPNDSYCFELLSLVLALSGSIIGREYLAQQQDLIYDILTLLHTSSDRVKRQVLSLIRRIIPSIKPTTFAQLLGLDAMSSLSDISAKIHNNPRNIQQMGLMDIFLSCIAKSLTVQVKIKSFQMKSRYKSSIYTMDLIAIQHGDGTDRYDQPQQKKWWLKGTQSKQIAQSLISLMKDMVSGQFGKEWSEVARDCIIENVLKLTELDEVSRLPEQCIQTSTLWLALASLCVLEEKDTEVLSSNNLSKYYHDQANGNSSLLYCDNHDDGETIAFIQCNVCGRLCADCDRFLHLNTKTRSHKRHIFKDESDSIKIDIHEGCGRLKFIWSLVVADSKLLKAMIEFRNHWKSNEHGIRSSFSDVTDNTIDNDKFIIQGVCRFCGLDDSMGGFLENGNVCQNEDCQRYALQACNRILTCGHFCSGIIDESSCMPCLHGCSKDLKQDGDDMCMICFSESLFSAPCIQLVCHHVFHYHCVRTVLEKRWSCGRITFTFSLCPICKIPIDHPSLSSLLEPIRQFHEDVQRKALMRLEYEGLNQCEAIMAPNARFYQDPVGFAMERYSYYLCFKCQKAYYGGEARCDANYDSNNFNAEELICGSCSDVTQAQICSKHGTDFLEYKCRFCCSVAVYFCFGSTHFCNACHDDFQRLVSLKEYPQCPVGPHSVPLDGEECPLHVLHPPTGQEFALGCGICRNAHTF